MTSSSTDRRLGLTGGTAIKAPCICATTANITLSGEQTIDGVTTSASRVLVKNQTSAANNGIYVSDTGTWSRDLDFDGTNDCQQGTLVFVTQGSSNGAGLFQITTADPITIGTTSITFSKIATLSASSVTQANVQNGQFFECSTVAGTNTITASTVGTAPASLGHGQFVFFIPANTNTGAATFNRDSLGGVAVQYNGAALIGGEMQSGVECLLFHDGTVYELMATSVSNTNYQTRGTVASASTVVLDTAKPYTQITGVVAITAITLGNGRVRFVEFAGILTLTNGASLILPSGANITTAAGDTAIFAGESGGVVRCLSYNPASGSPITGATSLVTLSSVAGTNTITATGPSALTAYSVNQVYVLIPAAANTGATTLNVSSIGAKSIFAHGGALTGGELRTGVPVVLDYDGAQFNVIGAGLDGFANQAVGTVLSGPLSGSAAQPTFRVLVTEGTAVATTSGTTATFSSLPSGIKRIVFMLKGFSTNSTSTILLQLSTSATFKVTGYNGGAVASGGSSTASGGVGFPITVSAVAADTYKGQVILTRESSSNNTWTYSGMVLMESATNTIADFYTSAGEVSLSGVLDGIRLTTVSADTFDAGEVNIQYE